ncbi:hypothetical protein [Marilutibacter aestuarii]|uniref:EF-hand domain-containing protein n=1 Tax=Marilutibacter aestuarii TaxID=1706195 RepID=A0A507ZXC6_9GAMM|nr:hypothetical protein [Lysobacter aestuarii]TQD40358.1 hypothetical protein FKV25_14500 [Lysobacter aestuarii]
MNTRSKLLLAMLVPGMALLSACTPDTDTEADVMAPDAVSEADTMAPPPVTDATEPVPGDMTPADGMDAPPPMEKSFAELDANMDGGVTQDELAPTDMLYEHFPVADADGDGTLTEAEITQHRSDMAAPEAQ